MQTNYSLVIEIAEEEGAENSEGGDSPGKAEENIIRNGQKRPELNRK